MRKSTRFILIGILVACGVLLLIETKNHGLSHLYDDVLYDNYSHYLPCDQLPTVAEVEAAMAEHTDVIARIEQISPSNVVIALSEYGDTCPGKADILIHYPGHQSRLEIEEILGGKTFFGIPCRFQNW
jgi:hypothetical protein